MFSLNKNKIRKNKTPVNRKFFHKRDILSKKVSKAKILARIVFFFNFFFIFIINIIIQTRVQPLKGVYEKNSFTSILLNFQKKKT